MQEPLRHLSAPPRVASCKHLCQSVSIPFCCAAASRQAHTHHPNDRRPDESRGLGGWVGGWVGGHGHRRCDSEASRAGPAISKPPRGLEHATVTLSTARNSGATRMRPRHQTSAFTSPGSSSQFFLPGRSRDVPR